MGGSNTRACIDMAGPWSCMRSGCPISAQEVKRKNNVTTGHQFGTKVFENLTQRECFATFPRNNLWWGFYATLELPALEFVGVATFLGSGVVLVALGSLHVRCKKLGHKKKHPNPPTSI